MRQRLSFPSLPGKEDQPAERVLFDLLLVLNAEVVGDAGMVESRFFRSKSIFPSIFGQYAYISARNRGESKSCYLAKFW